MADSSPPVGNLFKADAITGEPMNAPVDAEPATKFNERTKLAKSYVLDVVAVVRASTSASSILTDGSSKRGARRDAARIAISMMRAEKLRKDCPDGRSYVSSPLGE